MRTSAQWRDCLPNTVICSATGSRLEFEAGWRDIYRLASRRVDPASGAFRIGVLQVSLSLGRRVLRRSPAPFGSERLLRLFEPSGMWEFLARESERVSSSDLRVRGTFANRSRTEVPVHGPHPGPLSVERPLQAPILPHRVLRPAPSRHTLV